MMRNLLALVFAVACAGDDGDDAESLPPDPLPTASTGVVDTGAPTDPSDQVRVTVNLGMSEGGPLVDGPVSVAGPDGEFLFSARTDADGQVALDDVPDGASVTVVLAEGVQTTPDREVRTQRLSTVFDVQAGDHLRFEAPAEPPGGGGGSWTYSVAANPAPNAPDIVSVLSDCGGRSTTSLPAINTPLSLFGTCLPGPIELLAVNYSSFAELRAEAFIADTLELTKAGGTGSVSLDGWSTEHGVVRVSPPEGVTAEEFSTKILGLFGTQVVRVAGTDPSEPPGEVAGITTPSFAAMVVESQLGSSVRYDRIPSVPPAGQSVDFDLARTDFLPSLSVESFDLDTARPTIRVPEIGPDVACGSVRGDAIRGIAETVRLQTEKRAALASWSFVGAPTDRATLPELDPSLGSIWPEAGDVVSQSISIELLAFADADFAQVRQSLDLLDVDEASLVGGTTCTSAVRVVGGN